MSTEIDQQINELNLQKRELESKIAALDEQGSREAVLEGLRKCERHIFFRNNENIVLDTETHNLWTTKDTGSLPLISLIKPPSRIPLSSRVL